ncbi:MAG: rhomboid family intramembrane serine protease [Bacilli bacterium]
MSALEKRNLLVMKFLHYFITEKNYNPIIVHGIQDEIWLENLDSEYRIVRIILGYIHNNEQYEFDNYKVQKLVRQIKMKTFTIKMKVMSLYLDINDEVELKKIGNNYPVIIKNDNSVKKSEFIKESFPDMSEKLKFTEEGERLFEKINNDILIKNTSENEKLNDLFKIKKPVVTYALIGIITVFMIGMYGFGNGSNDITTLYNFGALVKNHEYVRLITSMFIHIGLLHYLMNTWALAILGKQVESFLGHAKTLIIFLYSGIIGNLVSLLLMADNSISAGASGAIFGLMGALCYFAFNYRTYMGLALKQQILPVILVNLVIGMMIPSINMFAHVGGLIAGVLIAIALGIKNKSTTFEKTNGFVAATILIVALSYLVYFR